MRPLWHPSPERVAAANLTAFRRHIEREHAITFGSYAALHEWSVREPERFWEAVWDFSGIVAETRGETTVRDREKMPGASWFPEARLNFAANLLRRRDDSDALVFRGETDVYRRLSWRELHASVSRLSQALEAFGICPGDRIAAVLPNLPETVVAMLAAASLGAVWSSCSPDFGPQGVLDRFGQITPRLLFATDGYSYAGKSIDSLPRLSEIATALPSVERVIVVPYLHPDLAAPDVPRSIVYEDFVARFAPGEIAFRTLPFNAPLYILYSSGTTGPPKCIVHGAGGTLIQHRKEHLLHCDVRPADRVFYFTTCGWMMWNWLASALASEATLLLYDGSPFHPSPSVLFDYADREGMTLFGTSAKFIEAIAKAGVDPVRSHRLESVRTVLSTGSPLAAEGFDYVYEHVKRDVCLSSISGGTDIISCFVGGDPTGPVWRGEIQARGLGMKVEVFDENGHSLVGHKGELVCTASFPSMPVGFWNDPDGERYRSAYFERFPGVWCHGDWAELTSHGGAVIHGRSDATLNPGGVRIGTAEIYRQVERLPEVLEGLVIGQEWGNDTRIVLFVRLREGIQLDDDLAERMRRQIRAGATPRHVPARIVQVADIPRTKSGKIVELAVREVVHGRPVKNREALANPEALDLFRDRPELRE